MGFIKGIFGGGGRDDGSALAKQQAEAASRRQLADLARQQADVDKQSGVTSGRKRGRSLLTFLGGEGQSSLA